MHFPTDLKIQSCPLANQIRAVATAKGTWHGQRAGSREFRLWRHTKSRLTLHGKLAKAKPWNCTTRFSHFVHDTISFSTAENRDSGAHVCKAPVWLGCLVDMPVCVEENSLMEIEDFHCALHSFSFFFLRESEGKLNWYEVSAFSIQCKSFKLQVRSKGDSSPRIHGFLADWQVDCASDWSFCPIFGGFCGEQRNAVCVMKAGRAVPISNQKPVTSQEMCVKWRSRGRT